MNGVIRCLKGVMVRLMLVLAPVMCILSGIAVSSTLTTYMKNLDVVHKDKKKKADATYPAKNEVLSPIVHYSLLLSCLHILVIYGLTGYRSQMGME